MDTRKDMLIECFTLQRDENFIFHGIDEGQIIQGLYNRSKINPKEPDLRLYHISKYGERDDREFLALWLKTSQTGRKYLIGNRDGLCYLGLLNLNRLSEDEPYITIYQVLKFNNKGACIK